MSTCVLHLLLEIFYCMWVSKKIHPNYCKCNYVIIKEEEKNDRGKTNMHTNRIPLYYFFLF